MSHGTLIAQGGCQRAGGWALFVAARAGLRRRARPRPISGCATTPASRVGIAIGYKDADGWTTEGWWNLPARTCETLLKGTLVARFYYVYAVDYDRGGEWSGQAFMCTRDKEFTIRGIDDCLARGYRPHRLLRGRYRRAARLDGAAHRIRASSRRSSRCRRAIRSTAAVRAGAGATSAPAPPEARAR